MKRILMISLMLLLLTATAWAVDVKLAWDANTGPVWQNVRIYEKVGANYTLKVEVAGTATQATITGVLPGVHIYIARSYAASLESVDSNSVTDTTLPGAPSNLRIIIVQVADDGTISFKALTLDEFKALYKEVETQTANLK